MLDSLSKAVAPVADPALDPVLGPVATTVRTATHTTLSVVDQVGEAAPVLERPVKAVTPVAAAVVDDVVDVVETRDVAPVLQPEVPVLDVPRPPEVDEQPAAEPAADSTVPAGSSGSRPTKSLTGQQVSGHWMVEVTAPVTPLSEPIDAGMARATQARPNSLRGGAVPPVGSSGPPGPAAPGPTTSHGGQDCAATPNSVVVVPVGAQGAPTGLTPHVAAPPPSDPGSSPD
jgi:hypothetical protein